MSLTVWVVHATVLLSKVSSFLYFCDMKWLYMSYDFFIESERELTWWPFLLKGHNSVLNVGEMIFSNEGRSTESRNMSANHGDASVCYRWCFFLFNTYNKVVSSLIVYAYILFWILNDFIGADIQEHAHATGTTNKVESTTGNHYR